MEAQPAEAPLAARVHALEEENALLRDALVRLLARLGHSYGNHVHRSACVFCRSLTQPD